MDVSADAGSDTVVRLTNRGRVAGALFVSLVCVGPDILARVLFH